MFPLDRVYGLGWEVVRPTNCPESQIVETIDNNKNIVWWDKYSSSATRTKAN
jgi:hypothetical protein